MKLHVLNRKVHYWASLLIAIPVLVMIGTGILLHLKKDWDWVQPAEQKGSSKTPKLDFGRILEICQQVPQADIKEWSDIRRVDVRPSRGMMKVWARNGYEIQIDSETGAVLQVEFRRSDTIEAIHDGSWFSDSLKYYLFFPAGIILFVMWLTGIYLFVLPQWIKWRRRRKAV
jgi:uncharacterized iron-regulated membrane protein